LREGIVHADESQLQYRGLAVQIDRTIGIHARGDDLRMVHGVRA
jgi:hypothetical protein